jgi:hypothetical protein
MAFAKRAWAPQVESPTRTLVDAKDWSRGAIAGHSAAATAAERTLNAYRQCDRGCPDCWAIVSATSVVHFVVWYGIPRAWGRAKQLLKFP